ncbi:MAG: hypothetical protein NXH95_17365 [Pseudomonadaceae bacterium]|nr:hypothetical protein [Pseudomonadaceae bacterium]
MSEPALIQPPEFQIMEAQQKVLSLPYGINMNARGGRGSMKSSTMILRMAQRTRDFPFADHVVIRMQHDHLTSLWRETLRFFKILFGPERVQSSSRPPYYVRVITGDMAATIDFRIYTGPEDEENLRGATWSGALIDEVALYPDGSVLADIGPSLRQAGIPSEIMLTQNPYGAAWLDSLNDHPDFEPFIDEFGEPWVTWCWDFRDNGFIDQQKMFNTLKRKMQENPYMGKSWFTGESENSGLDFFFEVCFEPRRSRIPQWEHVPSYGWTRPQLAIDPGGTAPSVAYLFTQSERTCVGGDGTIYPAGSYVLLDETDTALPDNLRFTSVQTIPEFCNLFVIPMCDQWGITRPRGVVDDAAFNRTGHDRSHADLFVDEGVAVRPARKGRREHGLARMRSLLAQANVPNAREEAGLYYCPRCTNFEKTLPKLRTHPRNSEDHETDKVDDHWADAARYALTRRNSKTTLTTMRL